MAIKMSNVCSRGGFIWLILALDWNINYSKPKCCLPWCVARWECSIRTPSPHVPRVGRVQTLLFDKMLLSEKVRLEAFRREGSRNRLITPTRQKIYDIVVVSITANTFLNDIFIFSYIFLYDEVLENVSTLKYFPKLKQVILKISWCAT